MRTKSIASGTLVLLAIWGLGACGAEDPPGGEAIAESTELAAPAEIAADAEMARRALRCGGAANLKCPRGLVCVMPRDGAADFGICVRRTSARRCDYRDPSREYVSRDPDACKALLFTCDRGMTPFFNECGCGCERAGEEGERCGHSVCGPREYCCNRSCSICAPLGGVCTQQFCE
jgi:hypothetical protein